MQAWLLPMGLLVSGGLGFLAGGRPALLSGRDRAREVADFLYPLAVAFFAGFVFSTLVPHALFHSHSRAAWLPFCAGLLGMGLLSKLVFKRDPCCEVGHDHRGFGALSLAAMSVCSVNDGVLIGLLDPAWFSGLNLGMLLHKATSSFAVAQLLGRTRFRGAGLAGFGLAYVLVSPAALLAARSSLVRDLPGGDLLLGFSSGMLVYVTLASMVPHAHEIIRRRPKAAFGFLAALAVSIALGVWHNALHQWGERTEVPSVTAPE